MQQDILKISLKDYKAQIDDLRASLLGLKKGSEEYNAVVEEVTKMQTKLDDVLAAGKRYTNAAEGSYNALSNQLAQLKREWKATADEVQRNEIGKKMVEINDKLKGMDASVGVYTRNVGNYANSFKEAFGSVGGVLVEQLQKWQTLQVEQ